MRHHKLRTIWRHMPAASDRITARKHLTRVTSLLCHRHTSITSAFFSVSRRGEFQCRIKMTFESICDRQTELIDEQCLEAMATVFAKCPRMAFGRRSLTAAAAAAVVSWLKWRMPFNDARTYFRFTASGRSVGSVNHFSDSRTSKWSSMQQPPRCRHRRRTAAINETTALNWLMFLLPSPPADWGHRVVIFFCFIPSDVKDRT